jgi:DNA-binding NtrC family response regulator
LDFGFVLFCLRPEAKSKIQNLKSKMQLRERLEILIDEMLEGRILLDEARSEFEKIYIQKALERNANGLSKTADALGIHRNTLSKKISSFQNENLNGSRRLLPRNHR